YKSWWQVPQVHCRHHDAHACGTFTFEAVEHRQEVAVESALLTIFKNCVGIVDEDDRRRIVLRCLKNPMDTRIEIVRARDERAINQKELASKTLSECAAYGCLTRARRPIQQHSAFRFQAQLDGERIIGER